MKYYNYFFIVGFITFNLSSCIKQQGPVVPEVVVTTVSFKEDIQPIFDTSCTFCHSAAAEEFNGELNLEADQSYNELINVMAVTDNSYNRVTPEHIENSALYLMINESGTFTMSMPLGADPLSNHNQNLIKVWIEEGALNN